MAFPNLIALILLSPVVYRATREYLSRTWVNAWSFNHVLAPSKDVPAHFPKK